MNRVKHLLNSHALYSLYTTLIIPYMNYCCEFWGNNYKSRIQPLYMLQKKAIRICKHEAYLSHTRPIFHYFNTLCIYDMIEYSSVVFMFKYTYNNQFPRHLLRFFERLYDSHSHNTRKKVNNFKIKYRTSQKASCVSLIGPKLWNNLHSDLQCSTLISRFKTHYKRMLLQSRAGQEYFEWCHPSLARFSLTRASLACFILTRSQFGAFQFGAMPVWHVSLRRVSHLNASSGYSIANLFIAGFFVVVHTFINHLRTIFIREDRGEVITSD